MKMQAKVKRATDRGRVLTGKLDVQGCEGKSICFCKQTDEEVKLAGSFLTEELDYLMNQANWIAPRIVKSTRNGDMMTVSFNYAYSTLSVALALEKRLKNLTYVDYYHVHTHHITGNIFDNMPQNRILIPISVHRRFHDRTNGINNYDEFIGVISELDCPELVDRYQNPDKSILYVPKSVKSYEEQEAEIWLGIGLTMTERNDLLDFLGHKIKEIGSSHILEFDFEF